MNGELRVGKGHYVLSDMADSVKGAGNMGKHLRDTRFLCFAT